MMYKPGPGGLSYATSAQAQSSIVGHTAGHTSGLAVADGMYLLKLPAVHAHKASSPAPTFCVFIALCPCVLVLLQPHMEIKASFDWDLPLASPEVGLPHQLRWH